MASRKAFALRLNSDIMLAVQRWADDDLRSVNSQIEFILREALRKSGRLAKDSGTAKGGGNPPP